MAGIISYGAYIPLWRLARDAIAEAWGSGSIRGERSVAINDEDTITTTSSTSSTHLRLKMILPGPLSAFSCSAATRAHLSLLWDSESLQGWYVSPGPLDYDPQPEYVIIPRHH